MGPVIALGVDPGTTTGWAIVVARDGKMDLLHHGRIKLPKFPTGEPDWREYSVKVSMAVGYLQRQHVELSSEGLHYVLLSVESQYIGAYTDAKGVRRSVSGALLPAQISGFWISEALNVYFDLSIFRFQPDEWRHLVWPGAHRMQRTEAKRYAVQWVKTLFGERVTQDEADAVGLAVAGIVSL